MRKPYCEACKRQFRSTTELLHHIELTHPNRSTTPNPKPIDMSLMLPETITAGNLLNCKATRERLGIAKDETTKILSIKDHEVFMRLEGYVKERVMRALTIANRGK